MTTFKSMKRRRSLKSSLLLQPGSSTPTRYWDKGWGEPLSAYYSGGTGSIQDIAVVCLIHGVISQILCLRGSLEKTNNIIIAYWMYLGKLEQIDTNPIPTIECASAKFYALGDNTLLFICVYTTPFFVVIMTCLRVLHTFILIRDICIAYLLY